MLPVFEIIESPNNSVLRTPLYGIIASLSAVIVSCGHDCDSNCVRCLNIWKNIPFG